MRHWTPQMDKCCGILHFFLLDTKHICRTTCRWNDFLCGANRHGWAQWSFHAQAPALYTYTQPLSPTADPAEAPSVFSSIIFSLPDTPRIWHLYNSFNSAITSCGSHAEARVTTLPLHHPALTALSCNNIYLVQSTLNKFQTNYMNKRAWYSAQLTAETVDNVMSSHISYLLSSEHAALRSRTFLMPYGCAGKLI